MSRFKSPFKTGLFFLLSVIFIGTASLLYAEANESTFEETPIEATWTTDQPELMEPEQQPQTELPETEMNIVPEPVKQSEEATMTDGSLYLKSLTDVRKAKALSDEERKTLHEAGFTYGDILKAEELSAYSEFEVADLLAAKGNAPNQTIKVERREDGTEISHVTDHTINNWNRALEKLNFDLFAVVDKMGIAPEALAKTRELQLTAYETYELAMLSTGFGQSFDETLKQYREGSALPELEKAYAIEKFGKSGQIVEVEEFEPGRSEAAMRRGMKLTAEEENYFIQNGIKSLPEMAKVKHLAKKYEVGIERVMEARGEVETWDQVPAELEDTTNE